MNSTADSYSQTYTPPDTLLGAALAPLDWTRSVSLVVAFSLLTALAAQIVIPTGPIPITGSTFAVLLTGALLGSRLGAMAMIVYLVEGVCGLPFFSLGLSGPAHLMGPTGGYLVAYPAAAFITGAFAENGWDKRFLSAALAMAVGSLVILAAGLAWFSVLTHTSLPVAFQLSVLKFIPGDIIKILLAAAVLPSGWALLKRKASSKS
ncbi:MAG: biotin transport system substrate-specific component [Pyrinomonadaceae bacterium]|jgi:biotin transport system substrate-specific component|nr:biotin transport system substrate-specific component [Pyrinomonadaceae bacterium]